MQGVFFLTGGIERFVLRFEIVEQGIEQRGVLAVGGLCEQLVVLISIARESFGRIDLRKSQGREQEQEEEEFFHGGFFELCAFDVQRLVLVTGELANSLLMLSGKLLAIHKTAGDGKSSDERK